MTSHSRQTMILAVIPARSGSKSIPHKNIRLLAGKPLLAHSIEHALAAQLVTRTIVSTDSEAYAETARGYGAEAPFLRPEDISQDSSTDLEAFAHALDWLRENEGYVPDICLHLRPTHPVRKVADIDAMIQVLLDNPDIDSARSVIPAPDTPFKMWLRDDSGMLSPAVQTDIRDAYNMPRQVLPHTFLQNASIDVIRTTVITEMKSMSGRSIHGYVMEDSYDIDEDWQLQRAEARLTGHPVPRDQAGQRIDLKAPKTFCVDIDGVLATIVAGNQYDLAEPLTETIQAINMLYDRGHHIVLFTARGTFTGIDWSEVTERQMRAWGVRHHELLFGKPAADYYIDDRLLSIDDLRSLSAHQQEP